MSLLPFLIYTKWQDKNYLPDEFVNWGVIVNLFRVSAGTAASFLWNFQKLRKGELPGEKSFASFIQLYA